MRTCEAPDCTTSIGLVPLSASSETMKRLGFVGDDKPLTVTLCLRHYLLAMNELLARAGALNKATKPQGSGTVQATSQVGGTATSSPSR